jgi:hypothetical protein
MTGFSAQIVLCATELNQRKSNKIKKIDVYSQLNFIDPRILKYFYFIFFVILIGFLFQNISSGSNFLAHYYRYGRYIVENFTWKIYSYFFSQPRIQVALMEFLFDLN